MLCGDAVLCGEDVQKYGDSLLCGDDLLYYGDSVLCGEGVQCSALATVCFVAMPSFPAKTCCATKACCCVAMACLQWQQRLFIFLPGDGVYVEMAYCVATA